MEFEHKKIFGSRQLRPEMSERECSKFARGRSPFPRSWKRRCPNPIPKCYEISCTQVKIVFFPLYLGPKRFLQSLHIRSIYQNSIKASPWWNYRINHRWIRVRHWEKLKSSSKITNLVDMQVFLNSKMQNFLVTYQDGPLLRNDLEIIYS